MDIPSVKTLEMQSLDLQLKSVGIDFQSMNIHVLKELEAMLLTMYNQMTVNVIEAETKRIAEEEMMRQIESMNKKQPKAILVYNRQSKTQRNKKHVRFLIPKPEQPKKLDFLCQVLLATGEFESVKENSKYRVSKVDNYEARCKARLCIKK